MRPVNRPLKRRCNGSCELRLPRLPRNAKRARVRFQCLQGAKSSFRARFHSCYRIELPFEWTAHTMLVARTNDVREHFKSFFPVFTSPRLLEDIIRSHCPMCVLVVLRGECLFSSSGKSSQLCSGILRHSTRGHDVTLLDIMRMTNPCHADVGTFAPLRDHQFVVLTKNTIGWKAA